MQIRQNIKDAYSILISNPFNSVNENIINNILIIKLKGYPRKKDLLESDLSVGDILSSALKVRKILFMKRRHASRRDSIIASGWAEIELLENTSNNGSKEI